MATPRADGPGDPQYGDRLTVARHATVVGLIAALFVGANLFRPLSVYDGGLAAAAGAFTLHGALPYRDYWWLYGPAAPALVAALTGVLGPSVLVLRFLGILMVGAQASFGYAFLRERVPHVAAALISIGAVGAAAFLQGLDVTAWSLAMTLALAGLFLRIHEEKRSLLAGALIGFAMAARVDVGCYALVAALLIGNRLIFLKGFAVVAVPIVGLAVLTTALSDLYEQLIWYPIVGPRQFRALPLPEILTPAAFEAFVAMIVVPKLAIVLAGVRLVVDRGRTKPLLVIVSFAALCQLQTFGRADFQHQAQAAFPAYLVLGWLASGALLRIREPIPRRQVYARLGAFGVLSGACALSLVVSAFSLPAAERGPLGEPDRELVAGIRTLVANTARDESIYVGLTDHRFTLINDMLVYYLADRKAGVRVSMFNPGVTNTARVQDEMARDLAATNTQVLLLDQRWAGVFEPENESSIPGSTNMDRYIAANYVRTCAFGDISVWATPDRAARIVCGSEHGERLLDILAGISGP